MYQGFKSFLKNSTQSVYRGNHTPPSPRGSWFVSRVCAKSRLNARMFTANVAVRRESDANEPGAVGALMDGGEGEGVGEDRRGGREGKEGGRGVVAGWRPRTTWLSRHQAGLGRETHGGGGLVNFVFDPVMPHSQETPRSLESGASWRQAGSWWTSPSTLR